MPRRKTKARVRVYVHDVGRPSLVFRWKDRNGRAHQQSAGTANRRKAERDGARLEQQLNDSPDVDEVTWDEFAKIYREEEIKQLDADTDNHWRSVKAKVDSFGSPSWLDAMDERWLARFSAWMLADLSPSTVESYLKRLRAALRWAESHGLLDRAPKVTMPKRRRKSKVSRGRPVTGEEFDRWLTSCDQLYPTKTAASLKRLLRGLLASGLRLEEAIDFWWDRTDKIHPVNVDEPNREILIELPWSEQKGKRHERVPCGPDLRSLLVSSVSRSGRVFPVIGKRGSTVTSIDYIDELISAAGKKAGIIVHHYEHKDQKKYASAHDLRRTFATKWAEQGLSPLELAMIMRADINTVKQYYVDMDAEKLARRMSRSQEGDTLGDTMRDFTERR